MSQILDRDIRKYGHCRSGSPIESKVKANRDSSTCLVDKINTVASGKGNKHVNIGRPGYVKTCTLKGLSHNLLSHQNYYVSYRLGIINLLYMSSNKL